MDMQLEFDISMALGREGHQGRVFLGNFDCSSVAVKRINLASADIEGENIFRQLNHQNIVKLLHCKAEDIFKLV